VGGQIIFDQVVLFNPIFEVVAVSNDVEGDVSREPGIVGAVDRCAPEERAADHTILKVAVGPGFPVQVHVERVSA